jgi:hypothetical protein
MFVDELWTCGCTSGLVVKLVDLSMLISACDYIYIYIYIYIYMGTYQLETRHVVQTMETPT